MKTLPLVLAALAALSLFTTLAPAEPLAVVDGTEITEADVKRALHTRYGPQFAAMPAERQQQVISQSLAPLGQELVIRQLLLNAAVAEKTEADPKEVKTTVDQVKGTLPPTMKFEDWLKQIGHTTASFEAEIADELKINSHVMKRLDALPDPTEAEIKKFYDENKDAFMLAEDRVQASHILVKTDPAAGEDGKKAKLAEIEKLRAQLIATQGAADFAKVATEHSDCPSSEQGGDLGAFGKGQMVPSFEKAAFGQKIGEVGEVVETQFGYHLIKVTAKVPAGLQALEVVRDQIASQLESGVQQETVRSYIDALEKAAKITRSKALEPELPQPAPPQSPPQPAE